MTSLVTLSSYLLIIVCIYIVYCCKAVYNKILVSVESDKVSDNPTVLMRCPCGLSRACMKYDIGKAEQSVVMHDLISHSILADLLFLPSPYMVAA